MRRFRESRLVLVPRSCIERSRLGGIRSPNLVIVPAVVRRMLAVFSLVDLFGPAYVAGVNCVADYMNPARRTKILL